MLAAVPAAILLALPATAQVVTEIPSPTVPMSVVDFDSFALGMTTAGAINNAATPGYDIISDVVLSPSTAAAGVYNTNAGQQALALVGGNLEIIDGGGSAAFDAFNGRIELFHPVTEFGFGVGDWNGPMIIDFYLAGALQTTFTSSGYSASSQFKYYQMTGGAFDRVDVRASTTGGNWVFVDFEIEAFGGTVNVGGRNDYYVSNLGLPSLSAPCPSPTVDLSIAASPHNFRVATGSAGSLVFCLIDALVPCVPGGTCLPSAGGVYSTIPSVLSCGSATNQSVDLSPSAIIFFSGSTGSSSTFNTPVTLVPGLAGLFGSTQAFIFDFSAGFVSSEAFNWRIVP